ncbi:MAG: biotin--[acetyl-CoA-carboxylase] ligase [Clostridium sp.]|nr:biotin--[acetyl-CoA-carboxylase] ligase [Clostridium sp.]
MKEEILKLLKEGRNSFVSGTEISKKFGVTRTAIWKYINQLKNEGYNIESVSKRGYKLISSPDILTYGEIESNLDTNFIGRNILYFSSIDSTNEKAKEIAREEGNDGTVIISEEQTLGKGRRGRNFISPKGKGIWMSIILKPDIDPMKVSLLTQIAAAALNRALFTMKIESFIKWPNDTILNGKKVSGILTEMNCELTKVNFVVLGIGINVNVDDSDFTDEVKAKATSLKIETGKKVSRKLLVALILNNFEKMYSDFLKGDNEYAMDICKKKSVLIGKEIRVIKSSEIKNAKAINLSMDGSLEVKYEDGKLENLISGEVSVRGKEGYV